MYEDHSLIIMFWVMLECLCAVAIACQILSGRRGQMGGKLFILPMLTPLITGLVQGGIGLAQKAKANKMAQKNKRPELEDNKYTQQAYDITTSQALKGMSDASMQAYTTNSDRGLSSSIDAILKGGGSANNIADLYEGNQSSIRALAATNQEMQTRNIQQLLMAGIKPKGDEERDKWYVNKYMPYQDTAALATSLSEQGMTNIFKGANTVGGAVLDQIGADLYKDKDDPMPKGVNNEKWGSGRFEELRGNSLSDNRARPDVAGAFTAQPTFEQTLTGAKPPPLALRTSQSIRPAMMYQNGPEVTGRLNPFTGRWE